MLTLAYRVGQDLHIPIAYTFCTGSLYSVWLLFTVVVHARTPRPSSDMAAHFYTR